LWPVKTSKIGYFSKPSIDSYQCGNETPSFDTPNLLNHLKKRFVLSFYFREAEIVVPMTLKLP